MTRFAAKDIERGQTILVPPSNKPALVYLVTRTPNGLVNMTFIAPNEHNMVAWIAEPDETVEVAPLEPVLPWDGVDRYEEFNRDAPPRSPLRRAGLRKDT